MRRISPVRKAALVLLALLGAPALAAGGAANLPQAPVQYGDIEAAQRGAAVFVNYCMGCHGMRHMRYGRMAEDLGISEGQIESFLIHNEFGLGDGMQSAMNSEDGKEWFYQAPPPDLSLSSRLRGPDWLYAYLRGFYRDPGRPGGWNNAVFENAAMPHVLADLQGVYARDAETGEAVQISEGRMTPAEYDELAGNLVAFMAYAGEPARAVRLKTGYLVMAFLLALLLASYFLYREYWKDIK
ncbi:MAG: cytochrome c1 [Betaproteobacteria bacterium]|nr:cytochrome c1 [Betaproteobacteria bacterium]